MTCAKVLGQKRKWHTQIAGGSPELLERIEQEDSLEAIIRLLISCQTFKKLRSPLSHPHNKRNAEQTESQTFWDPSENWGYKAKWQFKNWRNERDRTIQRIRVQQE